MIYIITFMSFTSCQKHFITNMPHQLTKIHIILITANTFK